MGEGEELFRLDPTRFSSRSTRQGPIWRRPTPTEIAGGRLCERLRVGCGAAGGSRPLRRRSSVCISRHPRRGDREQYDDAEYRLGDGPGRARCQPGQRDATLARLGGSVDVPIEQVPAKARRRDSARPSTTSATASSARPMRGCDASEQAAAWPVTSAAGTDSVGLVDIEHCGSPRSQETAPPMPGLKQSGNGHGRCLP